MSLQICQAFLRTPIGYLEVTGSKKGIRTLGFLDFRVRPHTVPVPLRSCVEQLDEYFRGKRQEFQLELDIQGTPFQVTVWNELRKIPFGKTITYRELSEGIGKPNAFRAAGGANGQNPLPVIIPCHRVIGSNGRLTGYRGGLKRKKWLLEHEHAFLQRDLFYGRL